MSSESDDYVNFLECCLGSGELFQKAFRWPLKLKPIQGYHVILWYIIYYVILYYIKSFIIILYHIIIGLNRLLNCTVRQGRGY